MKFEYLTIAFLFAPALCSAQQSAQCGNTPAGQLYQAQENVIYDIGNLNGAKKAMDRQHQIASASGVRNLSDERFIGEQIVMFSDLATKDFKRYKLLGGRAAVAENVGHDQVNPCTPIIVAPTTASHKPCVSPEDPPALYPRQEYKVVGTKRLYFYSAPNDACMQDIFVISGDDLTAYASEGPWLQVSYITKNGAMIDGWVRSDHLKPVGTVSPNPNHQ